MDLILRFENPDNVNYKMMLYKGPRSRGIGKPVLGNETILKDVKCGDVFCYKTFAEGYYTYKKAFDKNSYFGSIMPTVRFTYLNREKVQLYSAVSLGAVFGNYEIVPCYDLTLFGCTFGKKVFGFAEIGNGIGGWGRVGIGYRFDSKKK